MSSHVVIDDHDDLTDIGSLRHAELDKIILEGIIPTLAEGLSPPSLTQERSVGIPLLPSDNTFSGTNTFDTVNDIIYLYPFNKRKLRFIEQR